MKEKKAVGIIAEYNPFHKGHRYHLEESLKRTGADVSVVVMSGSVTQRGQFAMFDKWTRAEMAVRNGVDLVVEMPVIFSCNSAGYFAASGVEILENLGVCWISFGSESGEGDKLASVAVFLKKYEKEIESDVRLLVKEGYSYPRARQQVVEQLAGKAIAETLEGPNNILALEYLRYMSKAKPVVIKRKGPGYHEDTVKEGFASASYIRKQIEHGVDTASLVPSSSLELMDAPLVGNKIYPFILQKVLTAESTTLDRIASGGDGLGNRLKRCIRSSSSYEDLVDTLKSKRYTRTRICRFLGQVLLDITEDDIKQAKNYIRVLAFSEKGAGYLKDIKKRELCKLPVITNINKETDSVELVRKTLEKDLLAADLFNLAAGRDLYRYSDFVRMPRLVKKNETDRTEKK